jgi:hypothetical protein
MISQFALDGGHPAFLSLTLPTRCMRGYARPALASSDTEEASARPDGLSLYTAQALRPPAVAPRACLKAGVEPLLYCRLLA